MKRAILALLLVSTLGACAEINKPIGPNDPWRERATSGRTGMPLY